MIWPSGWVPTLFTNVVSPLVVTVAPLSAVRDEVPFQ